MRMLPCFLLLAALGSLPSSGQQRWWMDEPVSMIETNLMETDSVLDVDRLVEELASFPANAVLISMGGIAAHYHPKVEFHYASPHLPPGRDMFGEMLRKAHARGIRVVGRFDFSHVRKEAFDAHPEWFVRQANGEPVIYNGLYWTCINGGYYRDHVLKILSEALDRYDVDGLFFNNFGNRTHNFYSRVAYGPCHCDNCKRHFRARYNRELPLEWDADYREFISAAAREVAAKINEFVHAKRPGIMFTLYRSEGDIVDAVVSEANTSVFRPLPLWPYAASSNVNGIRNTWPAKMSFDLNVAFIDMTWRFAAVPAAEIQLRLWQAMAHGAGPVLYVLGTLDQEDRNAVLAARPVFRWHQQHKDFYVRQESAARVLLLGGGGDSYRGFFRILSEQHIPFAVSHKLDWIEERPQAYDLVISAEGAPAALDRYVRQGGRLLVAGAKRPELDLPAVVRHWKDTTSAYWRIRDHALLPSLKDTDVLFQNGEYLELEPRGKSLLTMIPPSLYGPPEKVGVGREDSDKPGLLLSDYGKGKLAYIPWDVGGLYYRHSSESHAGLVSDLVDHLLPQGRQLKTNAHPQVEITVMRQKQHGRTLVHFINLSGHFHTAYHAPIEMRNIQVELAEDFLTARSTRLGRDLAVARKGRYRTFTLPSLESYDVVVLE